MAAETLRGALAQGGAPPTAYRRVEADGEPLGYAIRGFYIGSDGSLQISSETTQDTFPVVKGMYFLFANAGDVAVEAGTNVSPLWAIPA